GNVPADAGQLFLAVRPVEPRADIADVAYLAIRHDNAVLRFIFAAAGTHRVHLGPGHRDVFRVERAAPLRIVRRATFREAVQAVHLFVPVARAGRKLDLPDADLG